MAINNFADGLRHYREKSLMELRRGRSIGFVCGNERQTITAARAASMDHLAEVKWG